MPVVHLRDLILYQAEARFEVCIYIARQSELSAQTEVYVDAIIGWSGVVCYGESCARYAVHLETFRRVVASALCYRSDVEQIVESKGGVLRLHSLCAPLAGVYI